MHCPGVGRPQPESEAAAFGMRPEPIRRGAPGAAKKSLFIHLRHLLILSILSFRRDRACRNERNLITLFYPNSRAPSRNVYSGDCPRKGQPPLHNSLRLLLLQRSTHAEILSYAAAVPPEHLLHHTDIAVHIHGVGLIELIQLPLKARHDLIHCVGNALLSLRHILAADAGLLKVRVVGR